MNNIIKSKTVAFSGYSADKLPNQGSNESNSTIELKRALNNEIVQSILDGMDTFIVGMVDEFDMFSAERNF